MTRSIALVAALASSIALVACVQDDGSAPADETAATRTDQVRGPASTPSASVAESLVPSQPCDADETFAAMDHCATTHCDFQWCDIRSCKYEPSTGYIIYTYIDGSCSP